MAAPKLTEREQQIARAIALGHSSKEVAAMLGLTVGTVCAHRFNIVAKLDLHNAQQLVFWALRSGLIRLEEAN